MIVATIAWLHTADGLRADEPLILFEPPPRYIQRVVRVNRVGDVARDGDFRREMSLSRRYVLRNARKNDSNATMTANYDEVFDG